MGAACGLGKQSSGCAVQSRQRKTRNKTWHRQRHTAIERPCQSGWSRVSALPFLRAATAVTHASLQPAHFFSLTPGPGPMPQPAHCRAAGALV